MALLQVENWDTFASLSDGSFKNYAQQSSPSFGEGSYLTPYTPRQSVTADGEGKGGVGKTSSSAALGQMPSPTPASCATSSPSS